MQHCKNYWKSLPNIVLNMIQYTIKIYYICFLYKIVNVTKEENYVIKSITFFAFSFIRL